jgi:hypothetical protein
MFVIFINCKYNNSTDWESRKQKLNLITNVAPVAPLQFPV